MTVWASAAVNGNFSTRLGARGWSVAYDEEIASRVSLPINGLVWNPRSIRTPFRGVVPLGFKSTTGGFSECRLTSCFRTPTHIQSSNMYVKTPGLLNQPRTVSDSEL